MRQPLTTLLPTAIFALCLGISPALVGCGDKADSAVGAQQPKSESNDHEGHDHGPGEDHDHDHGGAEEGTKLGSVTAAGTKIEVVLHGAITPGEEAHVDLKALSGPDPENVRGWIGVESGVGAMKGKAEPTSGGYHLHAEAPDEVTAEMKLWIEVEAADGTRATKGVSLEPN